METRLSSESRDIPSPTSRPHLRSYPGYPPFSCPQPAMTRPRFLRTTVMSESTSARPACARPSPYRRARSPRANAEAVVARVGQRCLPYARWAPTRLSSQAPFLGRPSTSLPHRGRKPGTGGCLLEGGHPDERPSLAGSLPCYQTSASRADAYTSSTSPSRISSSPHTRSNFKCAIPQN